MKGYVPIAAVLVLFISLFFVSVLAGEGYEATQTGIVDIPPAIQAPFFLPQSPQPDTILYDSGTIGGYAPDLHTYVAVRFTPTSDFTLYAIYFSVLNDFNVPDVGILYVAQDNGSGKPIWPATMVGTFNPPSPTSWIQFDLAGPIFCPAGQDFHIIYGPAPGGAYGPGGGWWPAFDNDSTITQRTNISLDNGATWLTVSNGDALIRAGGRYAGPLTISETYEKWAAGELNLGDDVTVQGYLTTSGWSAFLFVDEAHAEEKLIYPYSQILVKAFAEMYGEGYGRRWITLEGSLCEYGHIEWFGVDTSLCLENAVIHSVSRKMREQLRGTIDQFGAFPAEEFMAPSDWCRFAMIICTPSEANDKIRNAVFNDMCLKLIYKLGYGGYRTDHLAVFWEGGGVPGTTGDPYSSANGWSDYNNLTGSFWNPGPPKRNIPQPPPPMGATIANIRNQFNAIKDSIQACNTNCKNTELQILISSHGKNISYGEPRYRVQGEDRQKESDVELRCSIPSNGFCYRFILQRVGGPEVTYRLCRQNDKTIVQRNGVIVSAPNSFSSLSTNLTDSTITLKGIDANGDGVVGTDVVSVPQYLVLWGEKLKDTELAGMIRNCVDVGLDRLNIEIDCCFSGGIAETIRDSICGIQIAKRPEVNIATSAKWNETAKCTDAGSDTAHSYFQRIFVQELISTAVGGRNRDGVPATYNWKEAYDEAYTDFQRGYWPLPDTFPSHPQFYQCPGRMLAFQTKVKGERGRVPPPDTTWVPPDTFSTPQETYVDFWYYAPSELYPSKIHITPYYAEYPFGAFTPQLNVVPGQILELLNDGTSQTFYGTSIGDPYPPTLGYGMFIHESETMVGWKKWSVVDMYEDNQHRTMIPINIGGDEGLEGEYFNICTSNTKLPIGNVVQLFGENLGQLEPDQWSLYVPSGEMGIIELWVENPQKNVCKEPKLVVQVEMGVGESPYGISESEYMTFFFPQWEDRSCFIAADTLISMSNMNLSIPDLIEIDLDMIGPIVVKRCDWGDSDGDSLPDIQTEIVEMELTGTSSVGSVAIRLRPDTHSTGLIEVRDDVEVPCESFFDVFIEIEFDNPDILWGPFYNPEPIRVNALLAECPTEEHIFPIQVQWTTPPEAHHIFYDQNEADAAILTSFSFGRGESSIPGDPNGDGVVNVLDVLAVVNDILEILPLEGEAVDRADCSGDDIINVLDALGIVNVILGLGECVPGVSKPQLTPEIMGYLESLKPHLSAGQYTRFMNLVRSAYSVPTEFALFQNYPNPFNPATAVNYQIPMTKSQVQTTLKVYNILGQEVMTLVDELQGPGYYKATWDGRDGLGNGMPSGVYFCRLKSGNFTDTKRMLLVK